MDVISLFLGSALTILGGYVSNRQTSRLARATEIRKVRREKLERLAELVASTDDWVEKMQEDTFAIPPRHTPSDPTSQIYMLSDMYFPEVWTQAHEFSDSVRRLCQCVRKEASQRLEENAAFVQGGMMDLDSRRRELKTYSEEHATIYREVVAKREALIEALRAIVQKLDS